MLRSKIYVVVRTYKHIKKTPHSIEFNISHPPTFDMCYTKSKSELYYPYHRPIQHSTYSIYTIPLKGTLDKTHRKTVKRKYYFHSIKLRKIPMEEPLHKRNSKKKKN